MKNIILICADSLRRDAPPMKLDDLPHVELSHVVSENSCTEKSLPWMLSGMEVFSPAMSIPNDLHKLGYGSTLIHSNPIVDRFKTPFIHTIDISNQTASKTLGKKYNRIRHFAEQTLPHGFYEWLKRRVQGNKENYLPYSRIYDTLPHIPDAYPWFTWVHLMDPHTPYYPSGWFDHNKLVTLNNNHLSTVRGYYTPTKNEVESWKKLYLIEIMQMNEILNIWLSAVDFTKNTVIFTSDHGEEFGEHGEYGHKGDRFNPENVDVPFIVFGMNLPEFDLTGHRGLRGLVKRLTK